MIRRPPRSTLFPYHDALPIWAARRQRCDDRPRALLGGPPVQLDGRRLGGRGLRGPVAQPAALRDRGIRRAFRSATSAGRHARPAPCARVLSTAGLSRQRSPLRPRHPRQTERRGVRSVRRRLHAPQWGVARGPRRLETTFPASRGGRRRGARAACAGVRRSGRRGSVRPLLVLDGHLRAPLRLRGAPDHWRRAVRPQGGRAPRRLVSGRNPRRRGRLGPPLAPGGAAETRLRPPPSTPLARRDVGRPLLPQPVLCAPPPIRRAPRRPRRGRPGRERRAWDAPPGPRGGAHRRPTRRLPLRRARDLVGGASRTGHTRALRPQSDRTLFEWWARYAKNFDRVGVVDIVSDRLTTYAWGAEAAGYVPKSLVWVAVFERKSP